MEAVSEIASRSFEALAEGDNNAAVRSRTDSIRVFRAVLKAAPNDPWLHFQLGSLLGELGQVDEAVQECWLANSLEPTWELPLDEIAVIYFNAGMIEESRLHLEDIAVRQKTPSWNTLMKR